MGKSPKQSNVEGNRQKLFTTEEVIHWFAEAGTKSHKMPNEQALLPFVKHLNMLLTLPAPPGTLEVMRIYRHIRNAVPAARKAKIELEDAIKCIKEAESAYHTRENFNFEVWLPEVRALVIALDVFLKRHPPKGRGHPKGADYELFAASLAEAVADVLKAAGWSAPSISGNNAIVPHVVSKALSEVYRIFADHQTIARYLRDPERRREIE